MTRLSNGRISYGRVSYKKPISRKKKTEQTGQSKLISNIISDSDDLKKKVRELINTHSKKNIYSGIPNIKNKLIDAIINDLA